MCTLFINYPLNAVYSSAVCFGLMFFLKEPKRNQYEEQSTECVALFIDPFSVKFALKHCTIVILFSHKVDKQLLKNMKRPLYNRNPIVPDSKTLFVFHSFSFLKPHFLFWIWVNLSASPTKKKKNKQKKHNIWLTPEIYLHLQGVCNSYSTYFRKTWKINKGWKYSFVLNADYEL